MKENFNWRSFMAVPFLLGLFFIAGLSSVKAIPVYGVTTDNQLIVFDSTTPTTITTTLRITGLQMDETILGIDFRPANRQLYALGSSSRLYTINLVTGAATQVGATGAFTLNGNNFGFDFNPVVDRIRVVSDLGQNLRLNPDTGAIAAEDPALNPGMPNVTAAAYANNFVGSTSTVLYVIDTLNDTLFQQNPANAGTLIPLGQLGVNVGDINGFDIDGGNIALAAFTNNTDGTTGLYSINLTTGAATFIGRIGNGATSLSGLAIPFSSGGTNPPGRCPLTAVLDFNGDCKSDYTVFRPSNNTWYIALDPNNASRNFRAVQFGQISTDILTPGDYDGDGKTDVAVFRTTTGTFYVLRSSDNTVQIFQFGLNGDIPVARDYDGDGKTDFAVVRKVGANLIWFITNSSNNSVRIVQFGLSATDVEAPGDYDGDGIFDIGVYRRGGADLSGQATFFVLQSRDGFRAVPFGLGSDLVVPGDYDGDGKFDFAVVRTGSPYTWYILQSSNNALRVVQFGTKPFFTTQADYDGDGKTDISVYNPQLGLFYVLRSTDGGTTTVPFGINGDYPVANYDTH